MIDRRQALVVIVALLAAARAAQPQTGKVPRLGVLLTEDSPRADGLRQGLRELGYIEGQNIAVDWRWVHGRAERYPDLAAELVRLKVDVIVAGSNAAVAAAQKATGTIPIVMVYATDPVALGFVPGLARPGGNITGLTDLATELQSKRLQILKETLPNLLRLAVLWDPTEPGRREQVREAERAAKLLAIQPRLLEVRSPSEIESALAAMAREGMNAVLFGAGSAMIFIHRARIAEYALKSHLPAMFLTRDYVKAGSLISYGTDFKDLHRRAAIFVDKILKGAKPADLPVEQPTKFELVVNLKTARSLGLTIPPSVLLRADEVIQ